MVSVLLLFWYILCRWTGKCWHIQDLLKYEFDIEFDVSCSTIPIPGADPGGGGGGGGGLGV